MQDFLRLMQTMYPPERLWGFAITFAVVIVFIFRENRNPQRFLRSPFWNDVASTLWFPVYAFLIAAPLSIHLARIASEFAPFLKLELLRAFPVWLTVMIWFLLSDLSQYWLHRSLHKWRWLWTLHKVHHSQKELNSLTTWRVHWLEFVYLNIGSFALGLLLGNFPGYHAIAIGILAAFQIALHSDLDWNYGPLGKIFVSPHFHGRHHSIDPGDRNVNFGSSLVVWDHLFGTARDVPGLPKNYGLAPKEDDVPSSFLGQQLYPLSKLIEKRWSSNTAIVGEKTANLT